MKELSVIEMESISGAYSWDFSSLGSAISSIASNGVEAVASALLLGAITAGGGSIVGGSHGSDNGGIFGVGTIGMMILLLALSLAQLTVPQQVSSWAGISQNRSRLIV
ncbi:MAG: hypothetical protein ACLUQX_12780 [Thomasclavelia spiroformis]